MPKKDTYLPEQTRGLRIRGIAVFPKLDTPDTKFNAMGHYKTGVKVEGEEAVEIKGKIDAMIDAAFDAAAKHLIEEGKAKEIEGQIALLDSKGKPEKKDGKLKVLSKADKPYKEECDDDGNETGAIIFNTKTVASYKDQKTGKVIERKVVVVDAKRHPLTKPVYGGSVIIANVDLSPFHTAIGVGASLRLNGVQVIELRTSGRDASSMFSDEEGYEDDGATPVVHVAASGDDGDDGL